MLIKSVTELIGHTPLLEIDPKVHGLKNINLYAKLEIMNPFGSLKDRPAWQILGDELDGIESASQTVIESSSGNMAKAMQILCSMRGIPFRVVTNRFPVQEVKQVLQVLGAHISEFPAMASCPDPNDPNNPIAYIEREMNGNPSKYFHTSQFTNEKNMEAHNLGTGPEILKDLGAPVDYFITGLGTTGSSRGAGQYLKSVNPKLNVIGVVAPRGHFIPGIRSADEMFEIGLFKKDVYSRIVEASINESIDGILVLARRLGVLAGPTSGASYIAALKHLRTIDKKLKQKRNAVFIVCDRLEWYLSYLQKYRPELFGFNVRKNTPRSLPDEVCAQAPQVNAEQALKLLSANSHCLVVDLRGSLAYRAGHIEGAINIPADVLEEICEMGVPFSSKHHVLFVCPQGDDSRKFTAFLTQRGITSTSLKGGFIAWRDAGLPVQR
jgi:cysteine synthase/rhodanese-related sulfurtransferase